MGRTEKGRRRSPGERTAEELLAELQKRPERPIPALCEDQATLEGLIDLLVVKGIITEEEIQPYVNRYMSVITALVMLLVEKGLISDLDLEKAVLAYHFALRNCRPDASPDEIFEARRRHLNTLMGA
jgi:hypothetical protein